MAQNIREIIREYWPKAKVELERALKTAQRLLGEGEKHLKNISEKSLKSAKKLSLKVMKEKLYYDLGRLIARINKKKWLGNRSLDEVIKKIKKLDFELKKIK